MLRDWNRLYWSLPLGVALSLATGTNHQVTLAEDTPAPRPATITIGPTLPLQGNTIRNEHAFAEAEAPAPAPAADAEDPIRLSPGKTELVQERYANGAVKIARQVTQDDQGNFVNHGSWKKWDERGRVQMEGTYEFDRAHGAWTQAYYDDAPAFMKQAAYRQFSPPFTSRVTFEHGQLHGEWKVVDAKQLKVCEINFVNGQRDGRAIWYATNGRPRRQAQYRDGLLHGEMVDFGPAGEVTARANYEEGRQLAPKVSHHKGEQKKTSGMYLYARLVVQKPDDWWQGAMASYTTEGKDERHGAWTSWHPNGQVEQKGEFQRDIPVGKVGWWFANGQQALEGEYLNGKPNGVWTWWHANGIKATVGHYDAGVPVNEWMWWKEDGKVSQTGNYALGAGEVITIKPPAEPRANSETQKRAAPKLGPAPSAGRIPAAQRTQPYGFSR